MNIASIAAWQIFDSRGVPTVEAEVTLTNGTRGRGIAPSGASTGQFEALELRDRDPRLYRGKSVLRAIRQIEQEIAPALAGLDATGQRAIDERLIALDGARASSWWATTCSRTRRASCRGSRRAWPTPSSSS